MLSPSCVIEPFLPLYLPLPLHGEIHSLAKLPTHSWVLGLNPKFSPKLYLAFTPPSSPSSLTEMVHYFLWTLDIIMLHLL